jgi:hypothetical protein
MTVTDERIPAQCARGAVLLGAATARETQTEIGAMSQVRAVTPAVADSADDVAEPVTPTVTPAVADSADDVAEPVAPERDAEPRNAEQQKPVLRGLGAIIYARAQAREMRRNGRAERRNRARISRADAKAVRRNGSAGPATRGGILGWLRDLPTHALGIGVTVGWLMALAGSAVGQLAWWSSEFPWWIACLFALTFEAIMVGAGARARARRVKGRPAATLRMVSLGAAAMAAVMQVVHLGDPTTKINLFGHVITGSPALGWAFFGFTVAGFAVHELSEAAAINDRLREQGIAKPLGKRWFFLRHAIRARLLLIDQPHMSVDEAWRLTARRSDGTESGGYRAGFAAGRAARVRYGLGFAAGRAYGWMTAVVGRASVSVDDEPTGRTTVATPARETAPKPETAPAPRREVSAEDDAERTMPALRAVSESASEAAPQGKSGRRGVKREALEWVRGEVAAHRTPSKAAIMERFGIQAGSMRAYLSQWQASGDLPAAIVEQIKTAPAA